MRESIALAPRFFLSLSLFAVDSERLGIPRGDVQIKAKRSLNASNSQISPNHPSAFFFPFYCIRPYLNIAAQRTHILHASVALLCNAAQPDVQAHIAA